MENANKINVIIVDDCSPFAEGLKHLLSTMCCYNVVDIVKDGTEVVEHPMLWLTDLILMDVNMPGLNGIKAGKQVNFQFPKIKLVAISLNKEKVFLEELVATGFKGFLDKQSLVEDIENVLDKVRSDQYAFPKNILLSKTSVDN
ncbi:MAG: response regulator [Carboxylicivirga sp.]|jgi:DNA-binding NarL/FixJ family response regulator|nr:response regulator [Carboxylicivirga sp.]MCT4643486.1 response regulator [Carboxylicivirga sp.]